ncbi:unnamed protein product [Adineta ricciae]|uniref:Transmembrane protein n=1 Tax=Adineta ricciae TaxID=249248 RepID=A0A814KG08_ADIRI|nr:unnamed protein product [Adineta ricciae]
MKLNNQLFLYLDISFLLSDITSFSIDSASQYRVFQSRWAIQLALCGIVIIFLLVSGTIVLGLIPVYLTTNDVHSSTQFNELSFYTIYSSDVIYGRFQTLSDPNDLSSQLTKNMPDLSRMKTIPGEFLTATPSNKQRRQTSDSASIACEGSTELTGDLFSTKNMIELPSTCHSSTCREKYLMKYQNNIRKYNHRLNVDMVLDDSVQSNIQMAFCAFSSIDPNERFPSSACKSGTSRYIYIIDQDANFFQFNPRTSATTLITSLTCSTTAYPYSMAVQSTGTVWILFTDGNLYTFDVNTRQCQATSYVSGQEGFILFGMNFINDYSTNTELLYITSDTSNPPFRLATLDITILEISIVSYYNSKISARGELTKTLDGRLFVLFEGQPFIIAEINQTTGKILSQTPQNDLRYASDASNFAFTSYLSQFFIFVGDQTYTDIFLHDTRSKTTTNRTRISNGIVGSGVSPCL